MRQYFHKWYILLFIDLQFNLRKMDDCDFQAFLKIYNIFERYPQNAGSRLYAVPRIKGSPIDCIYGCLFDRVQTKPISTNFEIRRKKTIPECFTVVKTRYYVDRFNARAHKTFLTLLHTKLMSTNFLLSCTPNVCLS